MNLIRKIVWLKFLLVGLSTIFVLLMVNACGVDDGLGKQGETEEEFFTAIEAPANLTATAISDEEVELIWEDQSVDEQNFAIFRSVVDNSSYQLHDLVGPDNISYLDQGLTEQTDYFYYVKAVRGSFISFETNEASATTPVAPLSAPVDAPALVVAPSSTSASMSWTPVAGASGYKVVVVETGFLPFPAAWVSLPVAQTSYAESGLSPATDYYVLVQAFNSAGNGPSARGDFVTNPLTATLPIAPTSLNAVATTGTQASLTWVDNSDNEESFEVYKNGVFLASLAPNVTKYTATGLSSGLTYSFFVEALNGIGSAVSNTDWVTMPTPPARPTTFTVTAEKTGVVARWIDNADNENGFILRVSEGICPLRFQIITWYRCASVGADRDKAPSDSSYTVTSCSDRRLVLTSGTTYCAQIQAYNAAGTATSNNDQISY